MSKYKKVLLALIKTINNASLEQQRTATKALERLVVIDLAKDSSVQALDDAVNEHLDFWNSYAASQKMDLNQANPEDKTTLSELQQAAAEQCVVMGMQTATDELLIHILKHNPDECREYIAKRNLGNLATALERAEPGRELAIAPNILSDKAISAIKAQAVALMLPGLIKSLDKSTLVAYEKMSKETFISSITTALAGPSTHALVFSKEEYTRLRSIFTSLYLEEQIKSVRFSKPVDATTINSANADDMVAFIQSEIALNAESKAVLKQSVSDNLSLFRAQLAIHFIKSQKVDKFNQLSQLAKAEQFPQFQKMLGQLGLKPLEPITPSEMFAIQHAARSRMLAHCLNNYSTLGVEGHPQFIKAFALLPQKQQLSLLNNRNSKMFASLLASNSVDELHAVFKPDTAEAHIINDLVAENQRLALIKKIHNAVLAEVIAGVKPAISLNMEDVARLNEVLATQPDIDKMLASVASITGINALFIQAQKARIAAQQAINKGFRDICYEKNLSQDSHKPFSHSQRLIAEVFLRLKLDVSYDEADCMAAKLDTLLTEHHSSVDDFIAAVAQSDSVVKVPEQRAAVARALAIELTEARYTALQNERRAEMLRNLAQVKQAVAEISAIANKIKQNQKPALDAVPKLKSLIENEVFSAEGQIMHFGPVFDAAVKKRPLVIKEEFDALLAQATTVVRHLEANQKLIDEHLKCLPDSTLVQDQSLEKLRSRLKKDQEATEALLNQYRTAEKYLGKMVKEIHRVVSIKSEHLYNGINVTHRAVSPSDIERLRKEANQINLEQAPQFASISSQDIKHEQDRKKVIVTKELEQGQSYLYEVINHGANNHTTKASFILNFDVEGVDGTKGAIVKNTTCRIEMISPLTIVNVIKNPDNSITTIPAAPGAKLTPDDKANLYMTELNGYLAKHIAEYGCPSKEKPIFLLDGSPKLIEALWTALLVLGEQGKFKFGEEAICLGDKAKKRFNPDDVRSKSLLGTTKFAPNSMYENVFKKDGKFTDCVMNKVNDFDKIVADSQKTTKALVDANANTSSYKGALRGIKSSSGSNSALNVLTAVADGLSKAAPEVDTLSRLA